MITIRQDHLCPGGKELVVANGLYRRLGADRHENRGFDISVGGLQYPCARGGFGIFMEDFKNGLNLYFLNLPIFRIFAKLASLEIFGVMAPVREEKSVETPGPWPERKLSECATTPIVTAPS